MAHRSPDFYLSLSSTTNNQIEFLIKPAPSLKFEGKLIEEAFAVESPWRIVIDINHLRSRKNLTVKVKDNPLVKSVRLGAHSDKLRIVLDMNSEQEPSFIQSTEQGLARIIISPGKAHAAIMPEPSPPSTELPTNTPQPSVQPINTEAPQPTPLASATSLPSPAPTNTALPTTTATVAPQPSPTGTSPSKPTKVPPTAAITSSKSGLNIQSIQFDHLGAQNIPVVLITLSKQSQYKLEKQDEKIFAITIPDSAPGAGYLTLPQFPPHDFVGFTHVVCKQNGSDTTCEVGVERGVRVTAFLRDKQVVVKALSR